MLATARTRAGASTLAMWIATSFPLEACLALSDTFSDHNARAITVLGPGGHNNSPGNVTARCGHVSKSVAVIQELDLANAVESPHIAGGKTVTVTTTLTGGNSYWLPWGSWRAYVGRLGANSTYFVTASLTGCGIYVSGDRVQPYVVHANCSAAEVVDFGDDMRTYTDDLEAARMQFYGQLAAQLVQNGTIPSTGLQMLRPEDYGAKIGLGYVGPICVFGRRNGGNWTIYYCVGGRAGSALTRQLFPTFEPL